MLEKQEEVKEDIMETILDCNKCSQISITEEEQQKQSNKIDHICKRTGKRLYHRGKHPMIPAPNDCVFSEIYKMVN
jgi:hypothetical protein